MANRLLPRAYGSPSVNSVLAALGDICFIDNRQLPLVSQSIVNRTTYYVTSHHVLRNGLKIFDFYVCLVYNRSMVGIRSLAQESAC